VIACGRNETPLRDLQNENPTIEAIGCDITVPQDVLTLAAAIQDRHGRLDVLINNAGIMEHVDLLDEEVSDARIVNEIAVNLTGPILLTRRLLPLLRAGRDPLIVMVSSGFRCFRPRTRRSNRRARRGFTPSPLRCVGNWLAWASESSRFCRHWSIRRRRVLPGGQRCRQKHWWAGRCAISQKGHDESLAGKVGLLPFMMRLGSSYIARRVAET
jgi:hypothetical protein